MATETLGLDYLHDATDLSDYRTFTSPQLSGQPSDGSRFEPMASGRVRLITPVGALQTYQIQWIFVDRATLAWLNSKKRRLMLWRDTVGRGVFGAFVHPQESEVGHGLNECHVALAFTEITHSEAV